jgi:hypothetical protein
MTHTPDSPLEVAVPDLSALRLAKKNCNAKLIDAQVHHGQTNYLPEQFRRIREFNSILNEADFYLTEAALGTRTDLKLKTDAIVALQKELIEATAENDREEIVEDLAQVLGTATKTTGAHTEKLGSLLYSLSTSFDRTTTLNHLARCEAQTLELAEDIAQLVEKKSALDGERQVLTDAIGAIESKNIDEISREAILNAESMIKLGLTPPQIATAQAALDLLKQAQEQLSAALNYFGLISLRDDLRDRITRLITDVGAKNAELGQVKERIKLIESIHDFDDERLVYIRELSKIVSALTVFLDRTRHISSDGTGSVEQFIQDANALIEHLKSI